MFRKMTIASALAGVFLLAPSTISSGLAMPLPAFGIMKADVATEVRFRRHGFHGGRHFGRGYHGRRHHGYHRRYARPFGYGYGRRYRSYGYYRPYTYSHRYYGYGRGYGW